MKLQRNELKKLIKSGLNSSIIIRSPSDGIIDTLNVSQGQIVNAGDTLSQIIPERDRKLYLILWIPDMAVPYIKGDHVRIRYDAFAYEKFGQFNGIIHSISKEGANKQVISSQADSLIKISRIWADFFPQTHRISLFRLFFPPFLALFPVFTEISPTDVSFGPPETGWPG
jgi:membrane fusion protein